MKTDQIKSGITVAGVVPDENVTIENINWYGESIAEIIYKRTNGTVESRLLYESDIQKLQPVASPSGYTFECSPSAFRLVAEARRISQAYLYDPFMAVHSSAIQPLPHQITAVYEKMLPRHPLRYVLADDPAEGIEDAADYTFGIQLERGAENMQAAITDIQDELGSDINTVEYDSIQEQAQALHDGEVDAIIYNEAYTDILEEGFEGYKDSVKIIYTHEIRVEMNFGGNASDDSLTKEPFTVYISGIDVYGDVSQTSRSDVNIIAVVNPNTNQILLVTTPRDYYVEIPGISKGQEDKLTHAGIYGIDASMATLGALYETDINYYVRLNFTSLIEIVDILGGVDVYSDMSFSTGWESGYEMDVQEGWNHFNGEQALAFSRERKSLPDGDNQRGIHQQAVITAMLKKILSPTMLLKANSILNQVSQDVETNVSQAQLNALIKYQLGHNAKWSIRSVAATGTASREYCYSSGDTSLYVTIPDYDVVHDIIDLVNVVEEGGTLEDTEELN